MSLQETEQNILEEVDRRLDAVRTELERFVASALRRTADDRSEDIPLLPRDNAVDDPFAESATIIANDSLRGVSTRGEKSAQFRRNSRAESGGVRLGGN